MAELTISIRRARSEDAASLSDVFDHTWREAYQGILPAISLERMIGRRGPRWWLSTIGRGRPLVVLDVGEKVAGYASYGRCRDRALPADGEVDELYLAPEYQGLGFGKRMFKAVRNDLEDRGAKRVAVWCLTDNERACDFYRRMGGKLVAETTERFSGVGLTKQLLPLPIVRGSIVSCERSWSQAHLAIRQDVIGDRRQIPGPAFPVEVGVWNVERLPAFDHTEPWGVRSSSSLRARTSARHRPRRPEGSRDAKPIRLYR